MKFTPAYTIPTILLSKELHMPAPNPSNLQILHHYIDRWSREKQNYTGAFIIKVLKMDRDRLWLLVDQNSDQYRYTFRFYAGSVTLGDSDPGEHVTSYHDYEDEVTFHVFMETPGGVRV